MSKTAKILIVACLMGVTSNVIVTAARENNAADTEGLVKKLVDVTMQSGYGVAQELEATIDDLVQNGDMVTPALMSYFYIENQEFGFRHAAIRVLGRIGSGGAKENLKAIAVSEREDIRPNLKSWAATNFVELIHDKEEAVPLLDSKVPDVQNIALVAIWGVRVTGELIAKIDPLLNSESAAIRWNVARIYGEDTSGEFCEQKVSSLLKAANRIYTYSDANEIDHPEGLSRGQIELQGYINALSNMKGPLSALQGADQNDLKVLSKNVLTIARANKKDQSVKGNVISIIQAQNKDWVLRVRAVGSLAEIGTDQDIQFLQSVATTDSYSKKVGAEVPHVMRDYYPVREAARKALKQMQKKDK